MIIVKAMTAVLISLRGTTFEFPGSKYAAIKGDDICEEKVNLVYVT